MSTDDDWLQALTANRDRTKPPAAAESEPVSKLARAAYARGLRQSDSNLSRKQAKALTEKHDGERRQARQRNTH